MNLIYFALISNFQRKKWLQFLLRAFLWAYKNCRIIIIISKKKPFYNKIWRNIKNLFSFVNHQLALYSHFTIGYRKKEAKNAKSTKLSKPNANKQEKKPSHTKHLLKLLCGVLTNNSLKFNNFESLKLLLFYVNISFYTVFSKVENFARLWENVNKEISMRFFISRVTVKMWWLFNLQF